MGSVSEELPFEIKAVEKEKNEKLMQQFNGWPAGFVQVGPKGYSFPSIYKEEAYNLYNMMIKSSDVFMMSYPRSDKIKVMFNDHVVPWHLSPDSGPVDVEEAALEVVQQYVYLGSHWAKEMVWMLANNLDYAKSQHLFLGQRFPVLESQLYIHPDNLQLAKKADDCNERNLELFDRIARSISMALLAPSPRFIHTHIPLSLLPPSLIDTAARVIYIARDPRDVAVSYFHFTRLYGRYAIEGEFKDFWKLFIEDTACISPYFDHLKEAWGMRHHPNMLFLFYEDMVKDLAAVVRRVAKFLNKEYSEEEVRRLCEHLSFDNFRKNKMCNGDTLYDVGLFKSEAEPFIRKGKAGGWREYFDEEMQAQAQAWIADNLRGSDFRFPHIPDVNAIGEST